MKEQTKFSYRMHLQKQFGNKRSDERIKEYGQNCN